MHAKLTYPTLPYGRFFKKERVGGYRFGFNGQMKDDEVYGEGNSYTAEYWQYDPRLGRRWNVDPVVKPWRSPYDAFFNNPIIRVDPNGDDDFYGIVQGKITYLGSTTTGNEQRMISMQDYLANQEDISKLTEKSAIIAVKLPQGKTEGQYFEDLFISGMATSGPECEERSAELLLTYTSLQDGTIVEATLTTHTNSVTEGTGPFTSSTDSDAIVTSGKKNVIRLGNAHTHQVADFFPDENRNAANQISADGISGDIPAAKMSGRPVYSIDSQNIDVQVPTTGLMGGVSVESKDNIATAQSLFEGEFSILRNALETVGKINASK
jgi:RHS repeat-associated protein